MRLYKFITAAVTSAALVAMPAVASAQAAPQLDPTSRATANVDGDSELFRGRRRGKGGALVIIIVAIIIAIGVYIYVDDKDKDKPTSRG